MILIMNNSTEQIAVIVIKAWKLSPALPRWFDGVNEFFEYVVQYDVKTVEKLCEAHLAIKDSV